MGQIRLGKLEKRLLLDAYQGMYPDWRYEHYTSTKKVLHNYWGTYTTGWYAKPNVQKCVKGSSPYVLLSRALKQLSEKGLIYRWPNDQKFTLKPKGKEVAKQLMEQPKSRVKIPSQHLNI